jgi:hypothetical protein
MGVRNRCQRKGDTCTSESLDKSKSILNDSFITTINTDSCGFIKQKTMRIYILKKKINPKSLFAQFFS